MMETVTIDKDVYDELVSDQRFLECLRSNGVDNWDWYDEACREYQELYGDDNG
jgi:hypothetical protein